MDIKERAYILYRHIKAGIYSKIYYIFLLFPLRKNRIVFVNYQGKQGYGDHLKSIAEKIISRYGINGKYELIWLVNDTNKVFPYYIKVIKNNVFTRAFFLSTSGIWIDNYRKPLEVRKLRKQLYVNTWHGMIGFKKVGALRGKEISRIAVDVSMHDSSLVDIFLSNSKWVESTIREGFYYNGKILRSGSPRCDIFFDDAIRSTNNVEWLDNQYQYVLYVPTARTYNQNTNTKVEARNMALAPKKVCEKLQQKFGGQWKMLYRNHPSVKETYKFENEYVIDISHKDDLYEIMMKCSALISDYSSCVFDMAILKRPIFLFADDWDEYEQRRGLLWNIEELPFSAAYNESELLTHIENYNQEEYEKKLNKLFEEVDLLEDGKACERVIDVIDDWFAN